MACIRYIFSSSFIRSNVCSSSNIATQTSSCIRINMANRVAQFEDRRFGTTITVYQRTPDIAVFNQ